MGRAMKDSGIEWIGEAPASWKCYMLSQLATQVKNKNTGMVENNLLSLSYGKIKKRNINAVSGLLPESFEGYNIIEPDDIVLRLTDLQNDQTSLRVGISTQKGIVTSAYLTIRLTSANYPKYIYYYLHTFDVCKGLYGMGAGVRQGLNWEGMKKLPILLPDIEEQRRITEYLDSRSDKIDILITQTRTSIEEYKRLKLSVITRAVTKGVRGDRPMKESGIEWIGKIPEDWTLSRIKYIADIFGRIGFRGYTQQDLVGADEGAITLSPSNFSDMKMNYSKCSYISWKKYEESPEIMIFDGDVLFVKTGSTYGKSVRVIGLPQKATINPQLLVFKRIRIDKQFFLYFMQTPMIRYQTELSVVGGTIPTISQEKINNFIFIVPPTSEQAEIAAYLDEKCAEINALIAKKEQLLTELEAYKKSLIYEYVTGKKEVAP